MMIRVAMTCLVAVILANIPTSLEAAIRQTFGGQVQGLVADVKKFLAEDGRIKDRKVSISEFIGQGESAKDANSGLEIKRQFEENLKDHIDPKSQLVVSGTYHLIDSQSADNKGLKILLISVQITELGMIKGGPFVREVNDTDDLFQVLGLSGTAPEGKTVTIVERNRALAEAAANPRFSVVGHRVSSSSNPKLAVGILIKKRLDQLASPVIPVDEDGHAFIPVARGDLYEIELTNNDSVDTIAMVTVDGLDVANTFAEAKPKDKSGKPGNWAGYFVPQGSTKVVRGWLHKIDTQQKDNLFAFEIGKLGEGAASILQRPGRLGVITVQFHEAVSPGQALTSRSVGSPSAETKKGAPTSEKLQAEEKVVGENVLSTVSIRYGVPSE